MVSPGGLPAMLKHSFCRRPARNAKAYYEACLTKEKAIRREKQLKTGFGRKYLKNRI